jgi:hypothetical protein
MVVKDLLSLLFKYPVKGLVVAGGKDADYTGIIRKDKIIELSSSNSYLGLELEENLGKLMSDFTAEGINSTFDITDPRLVSIPVIDGHGNFVRLESPAVFLQWISQKEEDKRVREALNAEKEKKKTAAAAAAATTAVAAKVTGENGYAVLNQLLVPVLVTTPARLIIFANSFFLNSFNVEKDFILHQKMNVFLPKVKLENNLTGSFTYQHKKWQFRANLQPDRIYYIFTEIHIQKQEGYPGDLDKMIRDKADLRSTAEAYENWIIRKVHQRTKQNIRQTAQVLKIPEETLKYRLHKMK